MKKIFAIAVIAIAFLATGCKDGNKEDTSVDKTALTALVAECETLAKDATTDNYPQDAINTFKSAIEAVKTAAESATTEAAVNSLVSRLTDAKTAFLAAELDAINPDDVIFALSFDEGTGTQLTTTGKNAWTAVLQKGAEELFPATKLPEFVDGKVGKALHFADASHLSISDYNPAAVTGIKNLAISCWVKPDQLRASNYIVSINSWHVWKFQTQDGGKPFLTLATNNGITDMDNETDGSVAVGQWSHLVVSWDGATGNIDMYVNGELTKTWEGSAHDGKHKAGSIISAPENENVEIAIGSDETINMKRGADNAEISAWDAYFAGTIDELAVYSAPLTAGQVKKLYNSQK